MLVEPVEDSVGVTEEVFPSGGRGRAGSVLRLIATIEHLVKTIPKIPRHVVTTKLPIKDRPRGGRTVLPQPPPKECAKGLSNGLVYCRAVRLLEATTRRSELGLRRLEGRV